MGERLIDKSCEEFSCLLASHAAVPGGGAAAALVGALGTALCSMAGNLTLGKRKYADVEPDIRRMLAEGERLQRLLLELADEDARAFGPMSKAYAIPKDAPGRQAVLNEAAIGACRVPLSVMQAACETLELLEEMLFKGSDLLVSDVGCGAVFCRAALESSALNVFVNTRILTDREAAAALDAKADGLLQAYLPRAEAVARAVTERLRRR